MGNDEAGQPIIDTRQASSVLRVANRQTIVIGGLRQRDDIGEFNGIPYLKDLKVVGRLFRTVPTSQTIARWQRTKRFAAGSTTFPRRKAARRVAGGCRPK